MLHRYLSKKYLQWNRQVLVCHPLNIVIVRTMQQEFEKISAGIFDIFTSILEYRSNFVFNNYC